MKSLARWLNFGLPGPLVLLVFFVLLTVGCSKKETSTQSLTNHSSGNPLTAPVDYLGAVNQARKSAVRTVDLAAVGNAIQLFNAQEDRLPKDLNELVQMRYLPQLPALPAGSRYVYNPATGELKVARQ